MSDRNGHAQQQGIIRCRAGVGGQGSHDAMESPKALMCPLEKGVRDKRSMRLLGFTNFGESAWMFSFLRCKAVLLATMNLLL